MGQRVAFIGLGVMGYPMAGYLAKAGHSVAIFNRSPEKSRKWIDQFGGYTVRAAATPALAAENADFVFACVGNDDDLRHITLGSGGAFSSMKQNAVFVDHTTTSADVARELDTEALKRGFHFLDAPVSGGQAGAESGKLTVMVGGHHDAYERARIIFSAYTRFSKLLGPAGSGQLSKMVNQICIAGVVQGLSEALHFAKSAGLDAKAVVEVISKGAAQSWQMDNRASTMIDDKFDFGFAVDWMRKDLGITLAEAAVNGAHLPITALVNEFYGDIQRMGGHRWDTSSLIARLEALPKKDSPAQNEASAQTVKA